ncbi:hypothetical protein B0T21DRAFT_346435 [Apiosordaria backusii]|uniref:poly(ADP-ribose) glycohydrolase n=1 Tax=Apiosordaria backusii TaxID=314023 RepID=A0AA40BRT9_9PEZI|nr:hypothetical protein B0T21DRAFT_346435 [Apiosordaria backusii]
MPPSYPKFYLLPSSREYKCDDRFSLHPTGGQVEDENGQVPFWPVLRQVLSQPVNSTAGLIDILDTISVTLRGTSKPAGDYELLLEEITSLSCNIFFEKIWPRLVTVALEMPVLFPDDQLPVLGQNRASNHLRFSRRQVACLAVHQFLRTLSVPSWRDDDGTHDFGIWYSSQQRQPSAVRAYLRALMLYFSEVVCEDEQIDIGVEDWAVDYTLHFLPERYDEIIAEDRPLAELKVVVVEKYDTSPASLGVDTNRQAVVLSSNKIVGFGQSATQEEVHVGISPEACPIVLVTPPLGKEQILKVRGAQAMVNIIGKGRDITVETGMPFREGSQTAWKQRTMLFMDALELDLVDGGGLTDLGTENMARETAKAYTAFSSSLDGSMSEIRTGLWGCGAFGGDPEVKMLLLWLAASTAGVKLMVVCEDELQTFAQRLQDVVHMMQQTVCGTVFLRNLLQEIPKGLSRGETLEWLKKGAQRASQTSEAQGGAA